MFKFIVIILSSVMMSCSSLPPVPSDLSINQRFAVSTTSTKNWGILKNHKAKPVIFKDKVIVANGFDGIGLYTQGTGRVVWKTLIKNGVEATPTLSNGLIYFGGNDGVFYCMNANTGSILWTYPIKFEGLGKATVDNEFVYFTTGNHNLFALYKDSGKLKWIYTRKVNSKISVRGQSDIVLDGNSLYTGFSDGYVVSFNKSNGQINWEKKINFNRRFNDVDSTPVLVGETLFVSGFDGNLYAINKADGKTVWQSPYGSHTSILFNKSTLYSSTSKGELVAINSKNGKVIWSKKLGHGIATTPILYKGLLVYGEAEGKFQVVSSLNGKSLESYEVGLGIRAEVAQAQGSDRFYALSRAGHLFSFNVNSVKRSHFWPWEK